MVYNFFQIRISISHVLFANWPNYLTSWIMYIALEFNAYRKSKTFTVLRLCMLMGISIKKCLISLMTLVVAWHLASWQIWLSILTIEHTHISQSVIDTSDNELINPTYISEVVTAVTSHTKPCCNINIVSCDTAIKRAIETLIHLNIFLISSSHVSRRREVGRPD